VRRTRGSGDRGGKGLTVRRRRTWPIVVLAGLAAVLGAPAGTGVLAGPSVRAGTGAPADTVGRLHAVLLGVLREAETLGYQGRLARVAPAVDAAFDLDFMASKVVGRHWRKLGAADRERWRALFERLTCANYAGRFDRYSGQRFELLGEEPGAHATRVVHAKLVDPKGEDVELSYRLHETAGGWKIVDIYLRGTVSELALRRAEYSSVLQRDGFEALVTHLGRKIADLEAGRTGP
jgi:phospholipid transport system substrate-binding protein